MKNKKSSGDYFWRGGKRIELEKEDEFFTTIVKNEAELERIKALSGVTEVKPVQNRVFKVKIPADQRDTAMESIRSKELDGVCHHAYRPKNATNTRYYLTDQVVVKFKERVSREKIEKILSEIGVRILKEYAGSTNTYLLQVTRAAKKNPIKVANALAGLKEVEYAEPNLVNRFQSFYNPSDTYFDRQWHLQAWSGAELVEDADVSATEAWDVTRGKREVVVAIIDDGFDLSHPDFTGPGKIVHPKDYVDGDANPFPVTAHEDYHGTPCAGVALAEENGEGVVGISPGCSFMPVRFDVGGSDDDLLWEIFDYVGKRADVISCSWGPPPVYAPLGQLLTEKFHQLATSGGPRKKGCLIIFAAGNYNAPLNDPNNVSFKWYHPYYGLVDTQGPILNGEAAHPDVIAVASSTSLNRKAAYSNWGKEISVSSPSNNFHPLDRNISVPGRGIWTTDNEEFGSGFTGGSRFTGRFGGTSSATPLVAGVAALIISANKKLSAGEVKQILQETADKIIDPNPDPVLGLNKGSYGDDGHSEWFGFGRVNAAKAVQRARELDENTTGISELKISVKANGNLPEQYATKYFKITLGSKLGFTLKGPDGEDFDLYVRKGAIPTTEEYDGIGYSGSANEKVTIDPAQSGDYYVMVRSYRGSGDFEIKVESEE
jgi:subtilisin family serine protease